MTLDSNTDKNLENTDAAPETANDASVNAEKEPAVEAKSEAKPGGVPADYVAAEASATGDTGASQEAGAADDTVMSHEASAGDETAAVAEGGEAEDEEADAAEAAEADEEDKALGKAVAATGSTSMPTRAVAIVLVVALAVLAFLGFQFFSSKSPSYNLSKHDMEVLFQEMIQPSQQAAIASNPEEKKKLVDQVREILSVAAYADRKGYADSKHPEIQAQIALQEDLSLGQAYRKKFPDVKVTDDEVNTYYAGHPTEFETFLQNNPKFQQQAAGPNREKFKRDYGELKVVAEKARKEKIDREDATRVISLLQRCFVLRQAFQDDLDKNTVISDPDVAQYFDDHKRDFEEVRVRHVLISTRPQPAPPSPDGTKKNDAPKPLSKEEARKKADEVLAKAKKGEDFAALAKQYSDDPGSKDKGGEYPFFPHGQMVPEFEKAAFALQPGQISDVVETQFGYHIIKLEERRSGAPTDPTTRQRIVDKLKQEKIEAQVKEIVSTSGIVVAEDFDMTVKAPEPAQLPAGHPAVPSDR